MAEPRQRRSYKIGGAGSTAAATPKATPEAQAQMPAEPGDNQVPTPSKARLLGAGAVRIGSSLLAGPFTAGGFLVGGPIGAVTGLGIAGALGAGGELLAQAIEEGADDKNGLDLNQTDPVSLRRAAVEGGLAMIPGRMFQGVGNTGWQLFKSGAKRTAAASGVGELMREAAADQEIDPVSVGTAAVTGGLVGGALGPLLGRKGSAAAPPTPAKPVTHLLRDFSGTARKVDPAVQAPLASWYRTQGFQSLDDVLTKASEFEQQGMGEAAQGLRMFALRETRANPDLLKTTVARLNARKQSEEAYKLLDAISATGTGDKSLYDMKARVDSARRTADEASRVKAEAEAVKRAATQQKLAEKAAKEAKDKEALATAQRRIAELRKDANVSEEASIAIQGADPMTGETQRHVFKIKPKKMDDEGDDMSRMLQGDDEMAPPSFPPKVSQATPPLTGAEEDYRNWLAGRPDSPSARLYYMQRYRTQAEAQAAPKAPKAPAAPATGLAVAPAVARAADDVPVVQPRDQIDLAPGEVKKVPDVPDPAMAAVSENRQDELVDKFGGTKATPEPRDAKVERRLGPQAAVAGGRRASDPMAASAPAASPDLEARITKLEANAPKPRTPRVPAEASKAVAKGPALVPEDILTAEEIDAIAEPLVRQMYTEGAVAPDVGSALAQKVTEASKAYRLAKAAGVVAPEEMRALGKTLGRLGPDAETAGTIPKGYSRQVTQRVQQALQEAAEAKMQAQQPKAVPEPPELARLQAAEAAAAGPTPMVLTEEIAKHNQLREEVREILADPSVPPEYKKMLQADLDSQSAALSERMVREGVEAPPPSTPEGGTSIGFGLGGAEGLLGKHPDFAARLGLAAGGALAGQAMDVTGTGDPFMNMVAGGVGGFSAPTVLRMLKAIKVDPNQVPEVRTALQSDKNVKELGKFLYHLAPHIQRFNYLASMESLASNGVVGPYGSTLFASLQKAMSGDKRGVQALKELIADPTLWGRQFVETFKHGEGRRMIESAEFGDPLVRAEIQGGAINELGKWLGPTAGERARGLLQGPASWMATGDLTARRYLMRHGFTEQESREMTLTAEPWIPALRQLVNLRRGHEPSTFLSLLLPFVRTPANIVEQGLLRTPGLGYGVQAAREKAGAAPIGNYEQAVQQSIGLIVAYGSYVIGSNISPESARRVRKFVSNAAGPYSLLASVGFAAGMANNRSRGSLGFIGGATSPEMTRELEFAMPFPSMEPVTSAHRFLSGQSDQVPRGWQPGFFREAQEISGTAPDRQARRQRRSYKLATPRIQ